MLTVSWARKLMPDVMVNSCHPGDPCTKLSTALGYNLSATKDCTSSAKTPIEIATGVEYAGKTGQWVDGRTQEEPYGSPAMAQRRDKLFALCESFSRL
mmetsp:Transcript_33683/g.72667  ORF Transcript_33683/g.72667 Transcript_33683/m.72667 type:complete len:98 (+) Transcript_33683:545-838(+)